MDEILKAKAEAILFALGRAVSIGELALAMDISNKDAQSVINELMLDYENSNRGLCIQHINDSYIITTKDIYSEDIAKVVNSPDKFKFTEATLEILSIIAYKQPVTRAEIEDIRGVGCGNNINRLIEYELIEEKGRLDTPGHPILLGTTDKFLLAFNMASINELPVVSDELMAQLNQESMETPQDNKQLSFGDDISL